ncbi:MAG: site-specific integrase [Thiohalocapsa sp.]
MATKITKTVVDATQPGERPIFIWDIEVKGFGLRVLPTNVKSYVFQYRTPEGKTRRATIGKHGATLTADQARKKAREMQRKVADGGDPLEEKREARKALSVGEVLDLYLASAKFAEKAPSTRSIDQGRINRHLRPLLGKKPVGKVTQEDVRRAFGNIRDGKTAADEKTGPRGRAIVRGGEGTARSAIRLLRAILGWAQREGLVSANPAAGVTIGSDGARDSILESAEQYAELFRTLQRMEDEQRVRRPVADAIRVIALTGARRSEITRLRWQDVGLKSGLLTLPPTSHKTGRKTGKPRIIGLPAAAQAIIAAQPDGEPDDYVFAPAKGEGPTSLAKPWRMVRDEAGLPEGIGLHGLRHSLASHMAMQGAQAAEIMTALGHRQLATAQKYVHWAQDKRAALAEDAAIHITAALNDMQSTAVAPIKKEVAK